ALRAPGGENAARWLHLIAGTVVAVVIAPRLLLAFAAGALERWRATHFGLGLDEPYFQRLLRGYRGGPARVRVLPYSTTPSAAALAGAPPVAYGADHALQLDSSLAGTTLVALFNATATPERETHGAFLAALAAQRADVETLVALVDESTWNARFAGDAARSAERREAWERLGDEHQVPTVFVDLAQPDLAATDAALDAAIGDRNV